MVDTDSVEGPDPPATGFGLNDAVAPVGSPEDTVSATPLVKPLRDPIVTPYVVPLPWITVRLLGLASTVKSGVVTVSVTGVEWVRVPSSPVIVSGYMPGVMPAAAVIVS
jgi:hypothetical protein